MFKNFLIYLRIYLFMMYAVAPKTFCGLSRIQNYTEFITTLFKKLLWLLNKNFFRFSFQFKLFQFSSHKSFTFVSWDKTICQSCIVDFKMLLPCTVLLQCFTLLKQFILTILLSFLAKFFRFGPKYQRLFPNRPLVQYYFAAHFKQLSIKCWLPRCLWK